MFNLLGVLASSGAVAFGIISLLPVELILQVGSNAGFAMVFALLIAAIIWNLGTWAFGLPASSSHTLIGSIIGVGITNALLHGRSGTSGVDWSKAKEVGEALLFSPLFGFALAAILLLALKFVVRIPALYAEPKGDHAPPWWIRGILILTCTLVSFFHGSNDGQKGMGLIMLILIGTVPTAYALNRALPTSQVQAFAATSQAASAAIEQKAAGYNVLGNPRPAVTAYVSSHDLSEGTYPSLAALVREISNEVTQYGSIAKMPASNGCRGGVRAGGRHGLIFRHGTPPKRGAAGGLKMVAQLEKRLGVKLLVRTTRGLTATEAGLNYYERARRSIEEAAEVESAARGAGTSLAGKIRVAAAVTFARIHLMPRLPEFLDRHPDLEMDVVLDDRNVDLVGEGIDVGLRMGQLVDSSFTARRIASGSQVVVGTPTYFARVGEPTEPAALAAHQAVIYGQGGGGHIRTFRRDGAEIAVNLKGRLRVSAAEGVRAAVLANAGLAIASEWMFTLEVVDGTVKVVLRDWELPRIDLWAMFPSGRTVTTKARSFTQFVQEVMRGPKRRQSPDFLI
jgi:DNA-binding transcriptional LysR family regulator/phosphate/sulfate permease